MLSMRTCTMLKLLSLFLLIACTSASSCNLRNRRTGENYTVSDCNLNAYRHACRNDTDSSDVVMSGSISNATCPLLPTPTYGIRDAVFTVCAAILIKAPPSVVYNVIYDFDRYNEWNTFVINVELISPPPPAPYQVGSLMNFTNAGLFPPTNITFNSLEIITVLRPYIEATWKSAVPNSTAEHVNLILPIGGQSLYISYETFYGPTAQGFRPLEPALNHQFRVEARDTKRRAESIYNRSLPVCPSGYSIVSAVASQEVESCCSVLDEVNGKRQVTTGNGVCGYDRTANNCVYF